MRILVLDFSPILYANFFSASAEMQRNGLKPTEDENGDMKLNFSTEGYKEILQFKVFNELSRLKGQFQVDEIVIAADNPTGGYWRKDIYPIYKGQRKAARDSSPLQWDKAFGVFDNIKTQISDNTSFKLISVPRAEGDDVMFVLSEYLSLQGHEVVLHSLDHDTVYNLKHKNVQWWRHVKTAKKPGSYQEASPGEILNLEMEHIIQGDGGDNIKNIKSFSRFSDKFKEIYPDKTELQVYEKRFELDKIFENTYGESAYKHPRYGLKTFMRTNKTVDELLDENPIFKMNYAMNREIALPEGIPSYISSKIIDDYNTVSNKRNIAELQKYFTQEGSFELVGQMGMF